MNPPTPSKNRAYRTALLPRFLFILSAFAAVSMSSSAQGAPSFEQRAGYAGDSACLSCHQKESTSYLKTAHHLTSQLASAASVHGHFAKGENVLTIVDPTNTAGIPGLWFTMSARGGRFFETASTGFVDSLKTRTEAIDIVTGSGKRGQTYLYWQGDQLFELPISFWTAGQRWINSPGYDDGTANFSRPINPACLECHAAYLRPLSDAQNTNRFDRNSFEPGIHCETCHGPGARHVALEAALPSRSTPTPNVESERALAAIVNPARLSHDRQLDLCALCHNGIAREPLAPAFSYVPGEPLNKYFRPLETAAVEHPDVHGNQVGLLERSRCFRESPNMTCSTCHNVHAPEREPASYSSTCLTCHRWQACPESKHLGAAIQSRCIGCHMPVEPTTVIVSTTAGAEVHATMRNHWIKVYPTTQLP